MSILSIDDEEETVSPTSDVVMSRAADQLPGQYIVVFNDDVTDAPGLARRLSADHDGDLRFTYEHAIKGFAAQLPEAAVDALERNPNVAYVEADQTVHAVSLEQQEDATWGLDRIDQYDNDLDGIYQYSATGEGVTAYILDTGILYSHNDFEGRATSGFDAFDDGQNGEDCNGHGTHVAGTVGGAEWGTAKAVDLVAVRVLDCGGSGSTSGVIAGIDWVTEHAQQPAVANMSLGGGTSDALDDAVRRSIDAGISYSVAAGNGNIAGRHQDACNTSPARVEEAMTISATDDSDTKASFANYGDCVDWFAPGVSITSTWIDNDRDTNTISGTSMAAPHAAGVAALFLESAPGANPQEVYDAIYESTTKGVVSSSRTTNNHLLYSLVEGSDNNGGGDDPNEPPMADFTWSAEELSVSFTDTSGDSDGDVVAWSWDFGDGTGSDEQNPEHTYASEGTYNVTLTVTDDDGDSDSATQDITVSEGAGDDPTGFTLEAEGYKVQGRHTADLSWSGTDAAQVDIYRDGSLITTIDNDGEYTDSTNNRGSASYTYQVCEAGTNTCSNEVTVDI